MPWMFIGKLTQGNCLAIGANLRYNDWIIVVAQRVTGFVLFKTYRRSGSSPDTIMCAHRPNIRFRLVMDHLLSQTWIGSFLLNGVRKSHL